jgi:hypothetical protein
MPAAERRFWIQPFDNDDRPLLNPRVVKARTPDGAVKKLVRWLDWEGYDLEGLCVHIEEIK